MKGESETVDESHGQEKKSEFGIAWKA